MSTHTNFAEILLITPVTKPPLIPDWTMPCKLQNNHSMRCWILKMSDFI